jgi:hypothetical protein
VNSSLLLIAYPGFKFFSPFDADHHSGSEGLEFLKAFHQFCFPDRFKEVSYAVRLKRFNGILIRQGILEFKMGRSEIR